MLTKPQAFYDNIHKQALGYQNSFHLKKAHIGIKPTLYDGIVIYDKHVAMPVINDEETLILEEEIRLKMSKKEKDQEAIKQNISHKPIDYEKLNRLSDDFRKCFTPQQELSAEQAFWLRMSNPTSKPSDALLVKIEAPKELPKVFKERFDSIKKTRVRIKEQSDSLIDKLNLKSAENEDLKAQFQDKVFVITSLKNDLRKVKGKEIVDKWCTNLSTNTIVPGMFKLDLEPLAPRLLQNREAHIDYLKYTQEQADILWGIVEQAKAEQHLDKELDFACKTESSTTSDSNTPVLSSIGLKCSASNCRSTPTCNKRNDRISQTTSRNMENKVEAQPRKVNKKNRVVEPIHDINVKHSLLNANSEPICATCKKSMFDGVHDMCIVDFVENVNSYAKSAKKHKKQNIWKPTSHVFTKVGLKWKPTGRTFTIDVPDYSLVSGLRMFKTYDREPLLAHELSCALGKSKKSSHQPKAEYTNQEKLYLLHMDLCGPMRVASINGKRYILVIVDDYSRFTWVRFLRTKDEAPEAIIKCIKNIQVRLNATVRNVRTDNGTEFVNQALREFYENVGISHQTSVTRTPQ
ncbi:retrovirus-related pol polyprotein from transposon TNT 1-94 [Tanacetum coccineum]